MQLTKLCGYGPAASVVLLSGFFLAVTAVWIAGFSTVDFVGADAYDYAQMGRELCTGHGFSTLQMMPRHIPYFHERGWLQADTPPPNLYRYPLPILANTISQVFVADASRAAVVQTGVWFLAGVPMCFLLATRMVPRSVALLCAVAFVADHAAWTNSGNGRTESLATFLLLSATYIAFSPRPSKKHALALGAVCGLAYLARTQLGYLLPLSLILTSSRAPRELRLRSAVPLVLGFVLVVSPWLVRNFLLTADPMFSFTTTRILVLESGPAHSDIDMQLHGPIGMGAVWAHYGPGVLRKIRTSLWPGVLNPTLWTSSPFYGVLICAAALVASIVRTSEESRIFKRFTWSLAILVLVNFVTVAAAVPDRRYHEPLYPLILVGSICACFSLIELVPGAVRQVARVVAYGLLLAVASKLCQARFTEYLQRLPPSEVDRALGENVARIADGHGTVASDMSHATALYGELLSIRLPAQPIQLLEIDEKFLPIDYVVLSERVAKGILGSRTARRFETYGGYRDFRASKTFLDRFELVETLPNESIVYRKRQ